MPLVVMILLGWLMVVPSWADSPELTTPPGRFRLLHALGFPLVAIGEEPPLRKALAA